VLRSPQTDLEPVARLVAARWEIVAEDDYVARPRASGYRARHLVVRHGGVAIEVQLRTFLQDAWAEAYETVERNTDVAAREPAIQADVADLFAGLSRLFARREAGTIHGEPAMQELLGLLLAHSRPLHALQWRTPTDPPPSDR
jgi:ppGpp synthetase/RelA/SpoT-type nucleotidyltranferase